MIHYHQQMMQIGNLFCGYDIMNTCDASVLVALMLHVQTTFSILSLDNQIFPFNDNDSVYKRICACVLSRYASDASYRMGEHRDQSTTDTDTLLPGQELQRHVFVWRSR